MKKNYPINMKIPVAIFTKVHYIDVNIDRLRLGYIIMFAKKHRKANFSDTEVEMLVEVVCYNYHILYGKFSPNLANPYEHFCFIWNVLIYRGYFVCLTIVLRPTGMCFAHLEAAILSVIC